MGPFKADSPRAGLVIPALDRQIGQVRPDAAIRMLILHSGETGETHTADDGMAHNVQNPSARIGSFHYACSDNSTVQSIPENRVSWGVIGYNTWAIHLEQSGRAGQTAADWDDPYSKAMLDTQVVPLMADILSRRRNIALHWLTVVDLIACIQVKVAPSGVTTHANCTRAAQVCHMRNSGHTDPGPNYPAARVFAAASALVKRGS